MKSRITEGSVPIAVVGKLMPSLMNAVPVLADLAQLGETAQLTRRAHVAAAERERNLTDIDVAVRIDGDPVRSDEGAGRLALLRIAETGQERARAAEDADTMAEAGRVVHAAHAIQLANVDIAVRPEGHAVR